MADEILVIEGDISALERAAIKARAALEDMRKQASDSSKAQSDSFIKEYEKVYKASEEAAKKVETNYKKQEEAAKKASEDTIKALDGHKKALDALGVPFTDILNRVKDYKEGLVQAQETGTEGSFKLATGFGAAAVGAMAAGAAVVAIGAAAVAAVANAEKLEQELKAFSKVPGFEPLSPEAKKQIEDANAGLTAITTIGKELTLEFASAMAPAISSITTSIVKFYYESKNGFEYVKAAIGVLYDQIDSTLTPILKQVGDIASSVWDGMVTGGKYLWSFVQPLVDGIYQKVSGFFNFVFGTTQNFSTWGQGIVTILLNILAAPIQQLINLISLGEKAARALQMDEVANSLHSVVEGYTNLKDKAASWIDTTIEGMSSVKVKTIDVDKATQQLIKTSKQQRKENSELAQERNDQLKNEKEAIDALRDKIVEWEEATKAALVDQKDLLAVINEGEKKALEDLDKDYKASKKALDEKFKDKKGHLIDSQKLREEEAKLTQAYEDRKTSITYEAENKRIDLEIANANIRNQLIEDAVNAERQAVDKILSVVDSFASTKTELLAKQQREEQKQLDELEALYRQAYKAIEDEYKDAKGDELEIAEMIAAKKLAVDNDYAAARNKVDQKGAQDRKDIESKGVNDALGLAAYALKAFGFASTGALVESIKNWREAQTAAEKFKAGVDLAVASLNYMKAVASTIYNAFSTVAGGIYNIFDTIAKKAVGFSLSDLVFGDDPEKSVQKLSNALANLDLGKFASNISQKILGVIDTFSANFNHIFDGLSDGLLKAIDILVTKGLPKLMTLVDKLLNWIGNNIGPLVDKLGEAIVAIVPKLINFLQNSTEVLIQKVIPSVVELGKAIIIGLVQSLPQVLSSIMDILGELTSAIIQAIPDIIDAIIQAMPQIITAFIEGLVKNLPLIIGALVGAVVQVVLDLIALVFDAIGFHDAADSIRKAGKQASDAIVGAGSSSSSSSSGSSGSSSTSSSSSSPSYKSDQKADIEVTDAFISTSANSQTIKTTPGDNALIYQKGGPNDIVGVMKSVLIEMIKGNKLAEERNNLLSKIYNKDTGYSTVSFTPARAQR